MTSLAAWLISTCGVALIGIGGFFVAVRPPLLPEDVQFMESTFDSIVATLPGLTRWLRRVFWVLGGYIATTGVLVIYVASTDLRAGHTTALVVLTLAGVTSVGWMTIINFLIHSHFKWALLALDGLWASALIVAAVAQWS